MKGSILISCTMLYLLINQVQIGSSDPITITIIGAISSVITIYEFLKVKVDEPVKQEVKKQLNFLNNIEQTHLSIKQITLSEEMKTAVNAIPAQQKYNQLADRVSRNIEKLDLMYKDFSAYKKAKLAGTKFTLYDKESFITTAKGNIHHAIYDQIDELYHDVIGRKNGDNMVQLMYDLVQENIFTTCSDHRELQSFQQKLQNLLKKVSIAYLKGYLTIRFSEEFLNEHDPQSNVSHSVTLSGTTKKLNEVMNNTVNEFKSHLENAPQDVWRCDPKKHEEDVSFVLLNRVFKKQIVPRFYVFNDRCNLTDDDCICKASCDTTDQTNGTWLTSDEPKFWKPFYPVRLGADMQLYNCKNIEANADYDYTIYLADINEQRQFKRLVISDGQREKIFGPKELTSPIKQWKKPTNVYPNCNLCSCNIVDHSDKSYFVVGQMMADKDRIVTGARIIKHQADEINLYYIQIQQGTLLANGVIDKNSLNWKILSDDDLLKYNRVSLDQDCHNFETQDLDLPSNYVLRSIGFDGRLKDSINLAITGNTFDYATGRLNYGQSTTTSRYYQYGSNTEHIDLEDKELPEPTEKSSSFVTNTTVKIGPSSFATDLGQTTIPYLDIQDVTTNVPSLMSGAGLYYKYRKGFGGYLGLKLKTMNVLELADLAKQDASKAAELIFDKLSEDLIL